MSRLASLLFAALWGACFFVGAGGAAFGLGVAGVTPMVGPGYPDSYTVSCGTTATLIQSPYGQVAYAAFVDDAASEDVYFGDANVTTALGTPRGAGEENGGNVRLEYCRVASSAQTVRVRALVATQPDSLIGEALRAYHEWADPGMFTARIDG